MTKVVRTKAKAEGKKTARFLLFGVGSIAIIVALLISLSNVIVDIYGKYKEKEELSNKLMELREKEAELTIDVERMKDPEYVARYLREKFFYSKEGEYIIRMPEK